MEQTPAEQLHSPEEWDFIKPLFIELYQKQRWSLERVSCTLASVYGFIATHPQYKKRIKQWRAYKLTPEINSVSSMSGSVDSSAAENDSLAGYNTVEWPLQLPSHLRSIELARSAIQIFFPPDIGQLKMKVSHRSGDWDLGRFYVLAQTISAHMAESEVAKVTALSTELDVLMKRIISNKNPVIPTCILQVCSRFWQENQVQGLQLLLKYISDTARSCCPKHPLKLLCDALLYSLDVLPYLLVSSSHLIVEAASYHLTPDDPQTLSAQRGLYSALFATRDFSGALKVFTYVVDKEAEREREDMDATCMWRLDALVRLICCELSINRLDDAGCHIDQLAASLNAIKVAGGEIHWHLQYCYLDFQGELLRLRRDLMAVALLQEARDLASKNCDPRSQWCEIYAKRHLKCAILSQSEAYPQPFALPC